MQVNGIFFMTITGLEHWNDQIRKRIFFIQSVYNFSVDDIFPFYNEISEDIDKESFALSHLFQPHVFLRIRNNYDDKVIACFTSASYCF